MARVAEAEALVKVNVDTSAVDAAMGKLDALEAKIKSISNQTVKVNVDTGSLKNLSTAIGKSVSGSVSGAMSQGAKSGASTVAKTTSKSPVQIATTLGKGIETAAVEAKQIQKETQALIDTNKKQSEQKQVATKEPKQIGTKSTSTSDDVIDVVATQHEEQAKLTDKVSKANQNLQREIQRQIDEIQRNNAIVKDSQNIHQQSKKVDRQEYMDQYGRIQPAAEPLIGEKKRAYTSAAISDNLLNNLKKIYADFKDVEGLSGAKYNLNGQEVSIESAIQALESEQASYKSFVGEATRKLTQSYKARQDINGLSEQDAYIEEATKNWTSTVNTAAKELGQIVQTTKTTTTNAEKTAKQAEKQVEDTVVAAKTQETAKPQETKTEPKVTEQTTPKTKTESKSTATPVKAAESEQAPKTTSKPKQSAAYRSPTGRLLKDIYPSGIPSETAEEVVNTANSLLDDTVTAVQKTFDNVGRHAEAINSRKVKRAATRGHYEVANSELSWLNDYGLGQIPGFEEETFNYGGKTYSFKDAKDAALKSIEKGKGRNKKDTALSSSEEAQAVLAQYNDEINSSSQAVKAVADKTKDFTKNQGEVIETLAEYQKTAPDLRKAKDAQTQAIDTLLGDATTRIQGALDTIGAHSKTAGSKTADRLEQLVNTSIGHSEAKALNRISSAFESIPGMEDQTFKYKGRQYSLNDAISKAWNSFQGGFPVDEKENKLLNSLEGDALKRSFNKETNDFIDNLIPALQGIKDYNQENERIAVKQKAFEADKSNYDFWDVNDTAQAKTRAQQYLQDQSKAFIDDYQNRLDQLYGFEQSLGNVKKDSTKYKYQQAFDRSVGHLERMYSLAESLPDFADHKFQYKTENGTQELTWNELYEDLQQRRYKNNRGKYVWGNSQNYNKVSEEIDRLANTGFSDFSSEGAEFGSTLRERQNSLEWNINRFKNKYGEELASEIFGSVETAAQSINSKAMYNGVRNKVWENIQNLGDNLSAAINGDSNSLKTYTDFAKYKAGFDSFEKNFDGLKDIPGLSDRNFEIAGEKIQGLANAREFINQLVSSSKIDLDKIDQFKNEPDYDYQMEWLAKEKQVEADLFDEFGVKSYKGQKEIEDYINADNERTALRKAALSNTSDLPENFRKAKESQDTLASSILDNAVTEVQKAFDTVSKRGDIINLNSASRLQQRANYHVAKDDLFQLGLRAHRFENIPGFEESVFKVDGKEYPYQQAVMELAKKIDKGAPKSGNKEDELLPYDDKAKPIVKTGKEETEAIKKSLEPIYKEAGDYLDSRKKLTDDVLEYRKANAAQTQAKESVSSNELTGAQKRINDLEGQLVGEYQNRILQLDEYSQKANAAQTEYERYKNKLAYTQTADYLDKYADVANANRHSNNSFRKSGFYPLDFEGLDALDYIDNNYNGKALDSWKKTAKQIQTINKAYKADLENSYLPQQAKDLAQQEVNQLFGENKLSGLVGDLGNSIKEYTETQKQNNPNYQDDRYNSTLKYLNQLEKKEARQEALKAREGTTSSEEIGEITAEGIKAAESSTKGAADALLSKATTKVQGLMDVIADRSTRLDSTKNPLSMEEAALLDVGSWNDLTNLTSGKVADALKQIPGFLEHEFDFLGDKYKFDELFNAGVAATQSGLSDELLTSASQLLEERPYDKNGFYYEGTNGELSDLIPFELLSKEQQKALTNLPYQYRSDAINEAAKFNPTLEELYWDAQQYLKDFNTTAAKESTRLKQQAPQSTSKTVSDLDRQLEITEAAQTTKGNLDQTAKKVISQYQKGFDLLTQFNSDFANAGTDLEKYQSQQSFNRVFDVLKSNQDWAQQLSGFANHQFKLNLPDGAEKYEWDEALGYFDVERFNLNDEGNYSRNLTPEQIEKANAAIAQSTKGFEEYGNAIEKAGTQAYVQTRDFTDKYGKDMATQAFGGITDALYESYENSGNIIKSAREKALDNLNSLSKDVTRYGTESPQGLTGFAQYDKIQYGIQALGENLDILNKIPGLSDKQFKLNGQAYKGVNDFYNALKEQAGTPVNFDEFSKAFDADQVAQVSETLSRQRKAIDRHYSNLNSNYQEYEREAAREAEESQTRLKEYQAQQSKAQTEQTKAETKQSKVESKIAEPVAAFDNTKTKEVSETVDTTANSLLDRAIGAVQDTLDSVSKKSAKINARKAKISDAEKKALSDAASLDLYPLTGNRDYITTLEGIEGFSEHQFDYKGKQYNFKDAVRKAYKSVQPKYGEVDVMDLAADARPFAEKYSEESNKLYQGIKGVVTEAKEQSAAKAKAAQEEQKAALLRQETAQQEEEVQQQQQQSQKEQQQVQQQQEELIQQQVRAQEAEQARIESEPEPTQSTSEPEPTVELPESDLQDLVASEGNATLEGAAQSLNTAASNLNEAAANLNQSASSLANVSEGKGADVDTEGSAASKSESAKSSSQAIASRDEGEALLVDEGTHRTDNDNNLPYAYDATFDAYEGNRDRVTTEDINDLNDNLVALDESVTHDTDATEDHAQVIADTEITTRPETQLSYDYDGQYEPVTTKHPEAEEPRTSTHRPVTSPDYEYDKNYPALTTKHPEADETVHSTHRPETAIDAEYTAHYEEFEQENKARKELTNNLSALGKATESATEAQTEQVKQATSNYGRGREGIGPASLKDLVADAYTDTWNNYTQRRDWLKAQGASEEEIYRATEMAHQQIQAINKTVAEARRQNPDIFKGVEVTTAEGVTKGIGGEGSIGDYFNRQLKKQANQRTNLTASQREAVKGLINNPTAGTSAETFVNAAQARIPYLKQEREDTLAIAKQQQEIARNQARSVENQKQWLAGEQVRQQVAERQNIVDEAAYKVSQQQHFDHWKDYIVPERGYQASLQNKGTYNLEGNFGEILTDWENRHGAKVKPETFAKALNDAGELIGVTAKNISTKFDDTATFMLRDARKAQGKEQAIRMDGATEFVEGLGEKTAAGIQYQDMNMRALEGGVIPAELMQATGIFSNEELLNNYIKGYQTLVKREEGLRQLFSQAGGAFEGGANADVLNQLLGNKWTSLEEVSTARASMGEQIMKLGQLYALDEMPDLSALAKEARNSTLGGRNVDLARQSLAEIGSLYNDLADPNQFRPIKETLNSVNGMSKNRAQFISEGQETVGLLNDFFAADLLEDTNKVIGDVNKHLNKTRTAVAREKAAEEKNFASSPTENPYSSDYVKSWAQRAVSDYGMSVDKTKVTGNRAELLVSKDGKLATINIDDLSGNIESRIAPGKFTGNESILSGVLSPAEAYKTGLVSAGEVAEAYARNTAQLELINPEIKKLGEYGKSQEEIQRLLNAEGVQQNYGNRSANQAENRTQLDAWRYFGDQISGATGISNNQLELGITAYRSALQENLQRNYDAALEKIHPEQLFKEIEKNTADLLNPNLYRQYDNEYQRVTADKTQGVLKGQKFSDRNEYLTSQKERAKEYWDYLQNNPINSLSQEDYMKAVEPMWNIWKEQTDQMAKEASKTKNKKIIADSAQKSAQQVADEWFEELTSGEQYKKATWRNSPRAESFSPFSEDLAEFSYVQGDRRYTQRFSKAEGNKTGNWEVETVSAQKVGTTTQDWFTGFGNKMKSLTQYLGSMAVLGYGMQQISSGINFVKTMDKGLTNIGMTMGATDEELQNLGDTAVQTGKDLSTDASNVLTAMTVYANAGETASSIAEKSKAAIMLSNVTGSSAETTAGMLQGATAQFGVSDTEALNTLEKISSELPLDFAQGINSMSDAISNAGSVAHESGLSMQEFAAITGEVSAITRQEGSQIGNTLKTTMARISRSKSADEEVTGKDRSNAAQAYKDVLGYDLFDANGEYKDLSVTLDTLAGRWNTLTDAEKNFIAEQSAGTRGLNVFRTMMDNWGEIQRLTSGALSDMTYADENQEKWNNSLEGKSERLKASYEGMFNDILSSDTMGFVADAGSFAVGAMGKVTETVDNIVSGLTGWMPFGAGSMLGDVAGLSVLGGGIFSLLRTGAEYKGNKYSGLGQALAKGFAPVVDPISDVLDIFKRSNTRRTAGKAWDEGTAETDLSREDYIKSKEAEYGPKQYGWLGKLIDNSSDKSLKGLWNSFYTGLKNSVPFFNDFGEATKKMTGLNKLVANIGRFAIPAAALGVGMWAFNDINSAPAKIRETATNAYNQKLANDQQVQQATTFYKQNAGTYNELAKGVNTRTNENISLTNDEYQRYLDLTNQISQQFPSLTRGFDEQGNAILTTGNAMASMNDQINRQILNNAYENLEHGQDYANAFRFDYDSTYHGEGFWGKIATTVQRSWNSIWDNVNDSVGSNLADASKRGTLLSNIESLSKLNEALPVLDKFDYQAITDAFKSADLINQGGRARDSALYDQLGFGKLADLEANSDEFYREYATIRQNIKATEDAYKLQAETDMAPLRSLMESQAQIMRYSEAYDFDQLSDKDWSNLNAILRSSTVDQMSAMMDAAPDKEADEIATEYATKWANAFQAAGKDSNFSKAVDNLLSIDSSSSISDIRKALTDDVDQVHDLMRDMDMNLFKESLGLDDAEQAVDKFDQISDSLQKSDQLMRTLNKESKNWNKTVQDFPTKEDAFDARLEAFMDSRGINGMDAMQSYYSVVDDLQKSGRLQNMDWTDLERALDVQGFNADAFSDRMEMFISNVDSLRDAQTNLATFEQAARGVTGLDTQSLQSMSDIFSEIDGYEFDKLFELTGTGVRTNGDYLSYLNGQMKEFKEGQYDKEIEAVKDRLDNFNLEIGRTTDSNLRAQQIADRDVIESYLGDLEMARSQVQGLYSDTNQFLMSRQIGEEGSVYDSIAEIFSPKLNSKGEITAPAEIKQLYDQGLIGTDEFRKAVQLTTSEDVSTWSEKQLVDQYNARMDALYTMLDNNNPEQAYQTIMAQLRNAGLVQEGEAALINGVERGTGNIVGTAEQIAKALGGINPDLVETILGKTADYGYEWVQPVQDTADELSNLRKEADAAKNSSPLFNDINLGVDSLEAANKQAENLTKLRDKAYSQGLVEQYQTLEDYLDSQKGSFLKQDNATPFLTEALTDAEIGKVDTFTQKIKEVRDLDISKGVEQFKNLNQELKDINFEDMKTWTAEQWADAFSQMSTDQIQQLMDMTGVKLDDSQIEQVIALLDQAIAKKKELDQESGVKVNPEGTAKNDPNRILDNKNEISEALNEGWIETPKQFNDKVYKTTDLQGKTISQIQDQINQDYEEARALYNEYKAGGAYPDNYLAQDLILQDKMYRNDRINSERSVEEGMRRGYFGEIPEGTDYSKINFGALAGLRAEEIKGALGYIFSGGYPVDENGVVSQTNRRGVIAYKANNKEVLTSDEIKDAVTAGIVQAPEGYLTDKQIEAKDWSKYNGMTKDQAELQLQKDYQAAQNYKQISTGQADSLHAFQNYEYEQKREYDKRQNAKAEIDSQRAFRQYEEQVQDAANGLKESNADMQANFRQLDQTGADMAGTGMYDKTAERTAQQVRDDRHDQAVEDKESLRNFRNWTRMEDTPSLLQALWDEWNPDNKGADNAKNFRDADRMTNRSQERMEQNPPLLQKLWDDLFGSGSSQTQTQPRHTADEQKEAKKVEDQSKTTLTPGEVDKINKGQNTLGNLWDSVMSLFGLGPKGNADANKSFREIQNELQKSQEEVSKSGAKVAETANSVQQQQKQTQKQAQAASEPEEAPQPKSSKSSKGKVQFSEEIQEQMDAENERRAAKKSKQQSKFVPKDQVEFSDEILEQMDQQAKKNAAAGGKISKKLEELDFSDKIEESLTNASDKAGRKIESGNFFDGIFGGIGEWLGSLLGLDVNAATYEDGKLAGLTPQHTHEIGKESIADQSRGFRELESEEVEVPVKTGEVDTSSIKEVENEEVTVKTKTEFEGEEPADQLRGFRDLEGETVEVPVKTGEVDISSLDGAGEGHEIPVDASVQNVDTSGLDGAAEGREIPVDGRVENVDTSALDEVDARDISVNGRVDSVDDSAIRALEAMPVNITANVTTLGEQSIADQLRGFREIESQPITTEGTVNWTSGEIPHDVQTEGRVNWSTGAKNFEQPMKTTGQVDWTSGARNFGDMKTNGTVNWTTGSVDHPHTTGTVDWSSSNNTIPVTGIGTVQWDRSDPGFGPFVAQGTVNWSSNDPEPPATDQDAQVVWENVYQLLQVSNLHRSVIWSNVYSGPPQASDQHHYIYWENVETGSKPSGGKSKVNGTAFVSGSALAKGTVEEEDDPKKKRKLIDRIAERISGKSGDANAKGNWGLKKSGASLVGELGRELVVRGSKWFTIGDNGAEMRNLQKGDIVFNHKQTEEIFKKGKAISGGGRGKQVGGGALSEGTAYANGLPTSRFKDYNIWNAYYNWIGYQPMSDFREGKNYRGMASEVDMREFMNNIYKTSAALNVARNSAVDMAHAFDDNVTILDHVSQAITRMTNEISKIDTLFNNTWLSIPQRLDYGQQELQMLTNEKQLHKESRDKYWQAARAIGLDENTMNLAKEGSIDIQVLTDQKLAKQIQQFQDLYNKGREEELAMMQSENSILDHIGQMSELRLQPYINNIEGFESQATQAANKIDIVHAKGHFASREFFVDQYDSLQEQLAAQEEYMTAKQVELENLVNSGKLDRNSQEFADRVKALQAENEKWQEIKKSIYDCENAFDEEQNELFDWVQDQINVLHDENEFLRGLFETFEEDMFADSSGRLNINGATVAASHANDYAIYMAQANQYAQEEQALKAKIYNDQYFSGKIDKDTLDRYNEVHKLHEQAITDANNEKKAIQDLYRDQYDHMLDVLDKVIDKKKEQLEAEKDLYEYQKKVEDQVDDINELEKIYLSLQNDDSEEGKARRQEVKGELDEAKEDLEETEYDQWLSDQEQIMDDYRQAAEETFNERLDRVEELLEEANGFLENNAAALDKVGWDDESERQAIEESKEGWNKLVKDNIDQVTGDVGIQLNDQLNKLYNDLADPAMRNMTSAMDDLDRTVQMVNGEMWTFQQKLSQAAQLLDPTKLHSIADHQWENEVNTMPDPVKQTQDYRNQKAAASAVAGGGQAPQAQPAAGAIARVGSVVDATGLMIKASTDGPDLWPAYASNPTYTVTRIYGDWALCEHAVPGQPGGGWFPLNRLKVIQYATGGYTGDKEGLAYLHPQEMILNQKQFSNFSRLTDLIPIVVDQFKQNSLLGTLTDNLIDSVKSEPSDNHSINNNNTISFNITMNDVQNPEQFVNELRTNRDVIRAINDITEAKLTRNSKLGQRKGLTAL